MARYRIILHTFIWYSTVKVHIENYIYEIYNLQPFYYKLWFHVDTCRDDQSFVSDGEFKRVNTVLDQSWEKGRSHKVSIRCGRFGEPFGSRIWIRSTGLPLTFGQWHFVPSAICSSFHAAGGSRVIYYRVWVFPAPTPIGATSAAWINHHVPESWTF